MEELVLDVDLRFVFVGGKGGVGKTTSSTSLATCFAQRSEFNRVLLISTDPAHSLGDAFQREFPKGKPTTIEGMSLDVLEVDPSACLEDEIAEWTRLMQDGGVPDAAQSMGEFQDWLRQIPGIDEATAISNVINFIEEDKYDVVVFDTAPTGHTLKLLQLPKILSQGMEKLQSWNATLWTYWDVLQGGTTAVDCKHAMETRLVDYKVSMDKVGKMLQDHGRTQFVVVCIAEYLSVMETRRLMDELEIQHVRSGFVICNQLLPILDPTPGALLEVEQDDSNSARALRLLNARSRIQQTYLQMLHETPAVKKVVCVELQDREITGLDGLRHFANLLMQDVGSKQTFSRNLAGSYGGRGPLYPELNLEATPKVFPVGLTVEVHGLSKTPQYNGALGVIRSYDEKAERYGVFVENTPTQVGVRKLLALRPSNLRKKPTSSTLLEDSDIRGYLKDTRIWDAYMEVKKEPTKIKKFMDDPVMADMLDTAARKIAQYQKACGS